MGAIRSMANGRVLQLKCEKVLHESLLMPVLLYGSKIMTWRGTEVPRIRAM